MKEKQVVALNRLTALVNKEFDSVKAENVAKRLLSHRSKETCIRLEKRVSNTNTAY